MSSTRLRSPAVLALLGGLWLGSACASNAERPVRFELGSQGFLPGDAIVIEEVRSSTGDFRPGAMITVQGRAKLASRESAQLYLGSTSAEPTTLVDFLSVEAGLQPFELSHVLPASGRPHVSFYDLETGNPFGGVSFGTGEYLAAAKAWDADAVIAGQ